jgi:hypothetical protein
MLLKNNVARLITINHNGKRYDVKPGENPSVDVPDEACKTAFVQNLINTGQLLAQVGGAVTADVVDDKAEERAELTEMTIKELREHAKLLDLEGYSNLGKDELIDFILKA